MSYKNSKQGENQSSKRGILKNGTYQQQLRHSTQKEATFDEMNVLATYHPPGKDYGLMKIDEPKTPYHYSSECSQPVDPESLAKKLAKAGPCQKKYTLSGSSNLTMSDDEFGPSASFKDHRKQHYNMKEQLRRGKELAAKELAELED